jgi:hypothetical protein
MRATGKAYYCAIDWDESTGRAPLGYKAADKRKQFECIVNTDKLDGEASANAALRAIEQQMPLRGLRQWREA